MVITGAAIHKMEDKGGLERNVDMAMASTSDGGGLLARPSGSRCHVSFRYATHFAVSMLILTCIVVLSLRLRNHQRGFKKPETELVSSPSLAPEAGMVLLSPSPSPHSISFLPPVMAPSPAPAPAPALSMAPHSPWYSFGGIAPAPALHPVVPAFFIYGDSTVDAGNNNYLQTLARSNIAPYGRDFDTHRPTGRFSNGRLSVDYLASYMGLPLVPTYLGTKNATAIHAIMQGVNFASAGAGILNQSGSDLGEHIPLVDQVQHILEVKETLAKSVGRGRAENIMSHSIHYMSIGSNDYIHHYLRNVSGIRNALSPVKFARHIASQLLEQVEIMHKHGVRKIVSIGIGPLGCVPHYLFEDNSTTGSCIEEINSMVTDFNSAVSSEIKKFSRSHKEVKIINCNPFSSLLKIIEEPSKYGFHTIRTACCGAGRFGGLLMCLFPEMACSNAETYLWWDEFHPTERANEVVARAIWMGQDGEICEPMNLKSLASLNFTKENDHNL